MQMLLRHGYGNLGIQAVLDETKAPKDSFYHHFRDKEDFALHVIDAYVTGRLSTGASRIGRVRRSNAFAPSSISFGRAVGRKAISAA
jgi:AcrR family transcriptional regulator